SCTSSACATKHSAVSPSRSAMPCERLWPSTSIPRSQHAWPLPRTDYNSTACSLPIRPRSTNSIRFCDRRAKAGSDSYIAVRHDRAPLSSANSISPTTLSVAAYSTLTARWAHAAQNGKRPHRRHHCDKGKTSQDGGKRMSVLPHVAVGGPIRRKRLRCPLGDQPIDRTIPEPIHQQRAE